MSTEGAKHKTRIEILKFRDPDGSIARRLKAGAPISAPGIQEGLIDEKVIHDNVLLNAGINFLWTGFCGDAGFTPAYDHDNACIGVGSDSTGEVAAQTGLLAETLVEDCEDAWDELVAANVTSETDAGDFVVGTKSAKITIAEGAGNGILVTEARASLDMHTVKYLALWIKSSVALDAGDLQILLDDHAECVSPLKELNIPALSSNTWTKVWLDLGDASSLTAIISIGLKMIVDKGAFIVRLDDVQATNTYWSPMDTDYPEFGTSQRARFRSTFTSLQALFEWRELGISNKLGNHGTVLNRKTFNMGTKESGTTWTIMCEITLT